MDHASEQAATVFFIVGTADGVVIKADQAAQEKDES